MPKSKRINKKINKKIVKHKVVKHKNDKDKHTPAQMTKLEYEQSLMDPRFRAAMQGFNNTPNNAQQYLNHSLHEQEVKNNELTRQIVFQNDLANAKQANMQLKNELSTTKMQHQQELSAKQLEIANQHYKHEIETLQNKHKYDEQISQLNSAIANEKQQYADAQQRWKQKEDKHKAKYELQMQQLQSQHDREINDIKAITNDLARKTDIENMQFKAAQDVAQATVDLNKAQIQHFVQPITQRLEAMSNDFKRRDDILKTQYDEIKSYKNAQANLIKEGMKAHFEPLTRQLNAQADTLNNINSMQQLLRDEQSRLQNAKLKLSEAQIKAINEPLIHQLEQQKQQLEGIIKKNGDVNGLYQKMEDLKTQIEVLKQKATPEQIANHGAEVRDVALKTAPLQISQRLAQHTNQANLEYEQQYSKLVESGAQALGEAFDVKDIGTSVLNDKLKAKAEMIQKQRAILAAQTETINRQLEMQKGLENDKIENATARAKLDAITNIRGQYNQSIYDVGKARAKIEEDTNILRITGDQLKQYKQNHDDLYIDTIQQYNTLLDNDKSGTLRRIAKELNHGREPDPRQLPELLNEVKAMHDRTLQTLKELPPDAIVPLSDNINSPQIQKQREFMDMVFKMDDAFKQRNYYTADARSQFNRNLEAARNKIQQDAFEKSQLQQRITQLEQHNKYSDQQISMNKRVGQALIYNISRPVEQYTVQDEHGKPITKYKWSNLGARNNNNTIVRAIPLDAYNALPMTMDNFMGILGDSGVTPFDYLQSIDYKEWSNNQILPPYINPDFHPDTPDPAEKVDNKSFAPL